MLLDYVSEEDSREAESRLDLRSRSGVASRAGSNLAGQGGVHERTSRAAELIPVPGAGRAEIGPLSLWR
jgi:hypothetical protein